MKKILGIGLLTSTVLMVACGAQPPTEQVGQPAAAGQTATLADDQVEIRVAWWGSQLRHDRTVEVIDMFMAQYPHIVVSPHFFDSSGYWTVMNTLVAADDVWDVFQMGGNFPEFINVIQPLNDLIERGYIDITNAEPALIEATTSAGQIVGISNGVNSHGVAWDPALFDAAGVPHPHEDWTWETFTDTAMAITEALGIWGSSQFTNDFANLTLFVTQSGYNFFDPATHSTTLGFDDPSIIAAYHTMRRDLVQAGAMPDPGDEMLITDIEGDPIVVGQAAMTWVASNQFVALANAADRELRLINLPRRFAGGESGMGVNSSQMFSIAHNSPHQEAAAQFISFFQNSVEANQILLGERGIPIMSQVREVLQAEADWAVAETYRLIDIAGRLDSGHGNPIESPHNREIEDYNALLIEQVIFNMITPEVAAQRLFDFAQNILG